jgi:(p)ppGpp synthase/HD superfamily hydrolase
MTMLETGSTSADQKTVEDREDLAFWLAFWPEAVNTLQNHDTVSLTDSVTEIAQNAPNVDQEIITTILPHLEREYAKGKRNGERKFTNEPEINHSLQVGILVALAVGVDNLTTEQFAAALGHDYYENTKRPLSDIEPEPNPHVVTGTIIALSHQRAGERIFPKEDKTPYFHAMIENYHANPQVDIALIKVCDQIAVANGPLTVGELRKPTTPVLIQKWNTMSETKIGEMKQFSGMLQEAGLGESRAARLLGQAIPFTELRVHTVKEKPREIPLLRR